MDRMSPEPPAGQLVRLCGQAVQLPGTALRLELCGFDPRKPPFDIPKARPVQPEVPVPIRPLEINATALVAALPEAAPEAAPFEVDWSDSEPAFAEAEDCGDASAFNYRRYRFREVLAKARREKEKLEAQGKRGRKLATKAPRDGGLESATDGYSPWSFRHDAVSFRDEPPIDDDRPDADQVKKLAEILVTFYGLPGGVELAIRFRNDVVNLVTILEEAWNQKTRPSPLEEPPLLWVRGGRVYDFHGDRGTLAEFEYDLLTRQVEDDAVSRNRRRDQGLQPFPFLPIPPKQAEEPEEGPLVKGRR